MSYEFFLYEKKGRIAYVTINRPDRMNALHPPTNAEMRQIFTDFRDDPDVWVAILTGAGDRAFCAGNDLKHTAERDKDPSRAGGNVAMRDITTDFTCWKPIIAAVNGYALGGGLELAMACDIIVAADHAELGLPEVRVGLVAGTGVHRLPRHLPLKLAMGMMLTGRRISAHEAHRIGLVNEVVPKADLLAAAERWAGEILEGGPLMVRATKQAVTEGLDSTLDIALSRTYSEIQRAAASADRIEGPRAFAEKRKPNWTGT